MYEKCNAPPQRVTPPQCEFSPNMQLPLPYPTPPFCHDVGKGVVPNRVTQGKER